MSIVMIEVVPFKPSKTKVSPYNNDQFREPSLTIFMFGIIRVCHELMDIDPLSGEAAIKEMLPTDAMLTTDEVFEGLWVLRRVDRRRRPMLEAQE